MSQRFTTRPELKGTFGVVSSTHWLASQCGMTVLERGGNAFDAAAAAGFVLQVVEPHLNGLGGEVPIVLWDAARGKAEVICGQGPAPGAASIDTVRAMGLDQLPGTGVISACVPGAFGGWMTLLRDHGTWRLGDALDFAMGYAESGYPLLPRIAAVLSTVEPMFREHWPSSAATYLDGGVPAPWQLFRNRDLAATYRRLVQEAQRVAGREEQIDAALRSFYSGFVAEVIEEHCGAELMDGSGAPHRGLLNAEDLAAFHARYEDPVHVDFGGWTVMKSRPWSQGPVFLQQLRLLDGFDLGKMDFLSADHIHLVTECAKLAFADREAWYGDPDFIPVPLEDLLSREYAAQRRELVAGALTSELRPGRPGGREPRLPQWQTGGQAAGIMRGDTCHVAVADRHGNLVACTPSGGWLQSSPVIQGLGFSLGTRAQMFNLDPGHPNHLQPHKRPRTTLSPTLAVHEGGKWLAFGTPGGDMQDQWTLEFFLAHSVFGLDLQAAIDAPMFHNSDFPSSFAPHERHPGRLHSEPMAPGVVEELRHRGHEVVEADSWSLGRICAVGFDPSTRTLSAGASPRGGQALAVGR